MPGLFVKFHSDQYVAGIKFARRSFSLPFHKFDDLLGGNHDFIELIRMGRCRDPFFQSQFDFAFEPGINVKNIPF